MKQKFPQIKIRLGANLSEVEVNGVKYDRTKLKYEDRQSLSSWISRKWRRAFDEQKVRHSQAG